MTRAVKLPEPVVQRAEGLVEERDFATIGEAIRYMCQQGGFEVYCAWTGSTGIAESDGVGRYIYKPSLCR